MKGTSQSELFLLIITFLKEYCLEDMCWPAGNEQPYLNLKAAKRYNYAKINDPLRSGYSLSNSVT
jgi:hypothetical protein